MNFFNYFLMNGENVQISRGLWKTKELWSKKKKCGAKDVEKTRSAKDFNYYYVTFNIGYIEFFLKFLEYTSINVDIKRQDNKQNTNDIQYEVIYIYGKQLVDTLNTVGVEIEFQGRFGYIYQFGFCEFFGFSGVTFRFFRLGGG